MTQIIGKVQNGVDPLQYPRVNEINILLECLLKRNFLLDKYSFVLTHTDDKETRPSLEEHHARLRGITHLASRHAPSCLTFTYRVLGDSSDRLVLSVDEQAIWRSRLVKEHRSEEQIVFDMFYNVC